MALGLASFVVAQPNGGVLNIEVRGLRSDQGQILCFLYADASGFPADPKRALARVVAPIARRASTCRFAGVAPGAYAVAVVHDENGNGRLDRNLLGFPTEGVGASNNPVSHFGPPRFGDARFDYHGGIVTQSVQVHYL
jgi:uncharacterized protein (DUF2141 family)